MPRCKSLIKRDGQRAQLTARSAREFLPVRVTDLPARASSITIELAERLVLRLPESTSAVRIAEVVRALEEARR